jgi:hypothetical protein
VTTQNVTANLIPQIRVLIEKLVVARLVTNFLSSMEHEDLLPCPKDPDISSYPEPDELSLIHTLYEFKINFNITLKCKQLCWVLSSF